MQIIDIFEAVGVNRLQSQNNLSLTCVKDAAFAPKCGKAKQVMPLPAGTPA